MISNIRYFFFIIINVFLLIKVSAQVCGSYEFNQHKLQHNQALKLKEQNFDQIIYQQTIQKNTAKQSGNNNNQVTAIYTIPTVVHIIHQNGPENITDVQVTQQITDLNDIFRNIGYYDPATGVDVGIEFCLAKQDPNGNATTGINRVVSSWTNLNMETDDLSLKSVVQWDPTRYMNIWVVKDINSTSIGPTVAAYAVFPTFHGQKEDGIVCEATWFGSNKDNSKIMAHEVGHYLGLHHTFEGGCKNNNCATDNDQVCDTPPDNSTAYYPCATPVNTCTTDDDDLSANNPFRPIGMGGIGDQNDMIENYMDYGNKVCQSIFTQGQKDRMVFGLTLSRYSLLLSKVCLPPCKTPLDASFSYSPGTVTINNPVNFSNNSTGTGNNIWILNGSNVFSNNATPAPYNFTTPGTYTVTLMLTNGDTACTDTATKVITVFCNTMASFTASATEVDPNVAVNFTNTTTGGVSYQWLVDGVSVATSTNHSQSFSGLGGHYVCLVSYNGNCYDTICKYIQVGKCSSKEANHWYFGYKAGLDFSSGSPVVDLSGKLNTYEGSACISDKNGNLLFYTDGDSVWNKNHLLMANGSGLKGGESTTQAAYIVQKPKSAGEYYVFTVPCCANWALPPTPYLYYSSINMASNAGLGAVTTKNTQLTTVKVSEKIVGARHANGCDHWVIAHEWNTNSFFSYLVTSTGVNATPVISSVGTAHNGGATAWGGSNSAGYMKFSPDGKRMALAIQDSSIVELYDFDAATGMFSNPIKLKGIGPFTLALPTYGIEFSPDGTKLYVSLAASGTGTLFQFDLTTATTPAAIMATKVYIGPSTGIAEPKALQLGPDGKIYVAIYFSQYLGVINKPNLAGMACNYVNNAISMGSTRVYLGLPNFPSSFFAPTNPTIAGPDTVCLTTVPYNIVASCDDTITWKVLSGSATLNNATANPVDVSFNAPGKVTLMVTKKTDCGPKYDTLVITAINAKLNLGNDTALCSSSVTLTAPSGFSSYTWSTTATTQSITVNTAGNYWVSATSALGCTLTDTIKVSPAPQNPTLDLGKDTIMCQGNTILIDVGAGFASYKWQDYSDEQVYTITNAPGKYWVTVTTLCGTTLTDTIVVNTSNVLQINLKDTSICTGGTVTLDAGPGYTSYVWSNALTSQSVTLTQAGTYWVQVTNAAGCYATDSAKVSVINGNNVSVLGNDSIFCAAINVTLDAGTGFNSYTWSTAATTQSIQVSQPGTYWVDVANSQGCSGRDSIKLSSSTGLPQNFLGEDTMLCKSEKFTLNAAAGFKKYQWQDGSTSSSYEVNDAGLYWVLVTDNAGCLAADSLTVTLDDCKCGAGLPTAFSPNDDGQNDILLLRGNCITSMHLIIYDRWGEKMFETTDQNQGWDGIFRGKLMNSAVFVYYLQVELSNNTSISKKGSISLVR